MRIDNCITDESPPKWEKISFWILWAYFGFKSFYFAVRIRERVFPDEASWFGMIEVFSRSVLTPVDSPESYPLGLITHIPKLYFFLMGKFLTLNVSGVDDLIFLRATNVLLGLLTVFFSWKLASLLSSSSAVRLLFIVMLTNTMMYTFMFGAVSYDNLTNLLAVVSLYYLISFIKNRWANHLLLFFLSLLAGLLTKITFFPYAFALFVALVFLERKNLSNLLFWLRKFVSSPSKEDFVLVLACIVLFGAVVNLYAVNKVRYGGLQVTMENVLPIEACLNYRLFAKAYAVNQFKAGAMSELEAQRLVLQIRDPGDRVNAWKELDKAKIEKDDKKKNRLGRMQYTVEWVQYIFHRTYGIAAHLIMSKSGKQIYPYYIIFAVGITLFLSRLRSNLDRETGVLIFVTTFYLILLSQIIGYNLNYLSSGFVGLALTGRYIFPILAPLYLLLTKSFMERMPEWWQWGTGLAVAGVFIWCEFPWFMRNAAWNWYF